MQTILISSCTPFADIVRMLVLHQFAIVLHLLFYMVTPVRADGCFVPDTTWDADINQGITNVTSKVMVL